MIKTIERLERRNIAILDKAGECIVTMGPAVTNGAVSTFLAFILLSLSDTYIFSTFFKVSIKIEIFE